MIISSKDTFLLKLGIWVEPAELARYFGGSGREISSPNKIRAYWPGPELARNPSELGPAWPDWPEFFLKFF